MGLMEKWHHVMLNSSSNDVRPTVVDESAGEAPAEMDALANGVRKVNAVRPAKIRSRDLSGSVACPETRPSQP